MVLWNRKEPVPLQFHRIFFYWDLLHFHGIYSSALKSCADQLAEVFTNAFNMSLGLSVIPTCFKKATIVLAPKKSTISCLKNYRPMELIVDGPIRHLLLPACLPASLDSLQFTYHTNRSVGDAITLALHMSLSDLEWKNTLCENIVGRPQVSIQYQNAQQACHPSYMTWGWTDICATGSWTFWQVGHKWSELAASHSAQELLKAACSGPFLYSLFTRGVTVHVFVPGPFQYRTFGMVQVCTKCNL